jgi:hypothetical protein
METAGKATTRNGRMVATGRRLLVWFGLICNDLTRLVFYGGSVLPEWHNTTASARCLRKEIQKNATGGRGRGPWLDSLPFLSEWVLGVLLVFFFLYSRIKGCKGDANLETWNLHKVVDERDTSAYTHYSKYK